MGVLGNAQTVDERLQAMPGVSGTPDPGAFEGIVQATTSAIPAGINKIEGMLQASTSSFGSGEVDPATGQWLTHEQVQARDARDTAAGFNVSAPMSAGEQALKDWGQFDVRNAGSVSRVVHSTGEGLTVGGLGSAFSPWGAAALMGTTYGHAGYAEAKASGADTATAAEMGTVQGLTSAVGAFIPMKFGTSLLSSVGIGTGANVALGAAQRFASHQVLEANGYPVMAAQYRVWDKQAIAADLVLGGAFGVWGHFTHPSVQESLSPADVDTASAMASEQMVNHSAPGVPKDPETANVHVDALQKAVSDILEGRTPDVDPETAQRVVDGVLPDEANPPDAEAIDAAAREHLGEAYDATVADVPPQEPPAAVAGRAAFPTPDAEARSAFVRKATAKGVDAETAQALAPEAPKDSVTGYYNGQTDGLKAATVKRAQEHIAKTGEPGFYVSADLHNLGGLNAHVGNRAEEANVHYRAIADILRQELAGTGADVVPMRTGGDELGAVVVNAQGPAVDAALQRADAGVREYAKAQGLDQIPHAKRPGEVGVGLHLGMARITPDRPLTDIFNAADAGVHNSKIGGKYVARQEAIQAGAKPPGEGTGKTQGGTGEAVSGRGTESGAQGAEAQNPLTDGLDPFTADQLENLVRDYGDMPYVDENGNETTIREAALAMSEQRRQAAQDNRLHDIAAACAARNGG